jgi:hypothetical protein
MSGTFLLKHANTFFNLCTTDRLFVPYLGIVAERSFNNFAVSTWGCAAIPTTSTKSRKFLARVSMGLRVDLFEGHGADPRRGSVQF